VTDSPRNSDDTLHDALTDSPQCSHGLTPRGSDRILDEPPTDPLRCSDGRHDAATQAAMQRQTLQDAVMKSAKLGWNPARCSNGMDEGATEPSTTHRRTHHEVATESAEQRRPPRCSDRLPATQPRTHRGCHLLTRSLASHSGMRRLPFLGHLHLNPPEQCLLSHSGRVAIECICTALRSLAEATPAPGRLHEYPSASAVAFLSHPWRPSPAALDLQRSTPRSSAFTTVMVSN
jgi:hypothetical protein